MISRQGRDMSRAFPELIAELEQLPEGTAIDGELVILDDSGRPQFDELLGRASSFRPATIARNARARPAAIFAWDILMHAGKDARQLPLLWRKRILEEALMGLSRIHLANHIEEQGERMYAEVQVLELEGIVAKRADSPYPSGRTSDWLKIKTPIGRERESKRMEHLAK
jgi:ATP-dependent DNA ligase